MVLSLRRFRPLTVCAIVILLLELCASIWPVYGKAIWVVWICLSLVILAAAASDLTFLILSFARLEAVLTPCAVIFSIYIIASGIILPQNLSGEITQEISCALHYFDKDPGFGARKTCLFGYPARQLFLPSMFSAWFGRSQLDLNLGGAIWLLAGLPVFGAGLIRKFSNFPKFRADMLAALAVAILPHFFYYNHFAFSYEQSIFPLSFSLLAIGFACSFIALDRSYFFYLAVGVLLIAVHSYTPSLSLVLLGIILLVESLRRNTFPRIESASAMLLLICSLVISYSYRTDAVAARGAVDFVKYAEDFRDAWLHLFYLIPGPYMLSDWVHIPVLVLLFAVLLGALGWRYALLSAWIFAVIMAAYISKGYVYYGFGFRHHRALVAAPFVGLLISEVFRVYFKRKYFDYVLLPLVLAMMFGGAYIQSQFLLNKNPGRHFSYIDYMIPEMTNEPTKLLFAEPLYKDYVSIDDILKYFYPKADSQVLPLECKPWVLEESKKTSVLILNDLTLDQLPSCFRDYHQSFAPHAVLNWDFEGSGKNLRITVLKRKSI